VDYSHKIAAPLQNPAYRRLVKDPTETVERKTYLLLKRSTLAQEVCRRLRHTGARPPRLYGFPKIHNKGVPLRPIVSNIGVPTYKLLRHCAASRKVTGSIPVGVI
jgi:hypothetical protein